MSDAFSGIQTSDTGTSRPSSSSCSGPSAAGRSFAGRESLSDSGSKPSRSAAGILAGAVGAATYYLMRTLLARERLEGPEQGPERLPERTGGDA